MTPGVFRGALAYELDDGRRFEVRRDFSTTDVLTQLIDADAWRRRLRPVRARTARQRPLRAQAPGHVAQRFRELRLHLTGRDLRAGQERPDRDRRRHRRPRRLRPPRRLRREGDRRARDRRRQDRLATAPAPPTSRSPATTSVAPKKNSPPPTQARHSLAEKASRLDGSAGERPSARRAGRRTPSAPPSAPRSTRLRDQLRRSTKPKRFSAEPPPASLSWRRTPAAPSPPCATRSWPCAARSRACSSRSRSYANPARTASLPNSPTTSASNTKPSATPPAPSPKSRSVPSKPSPTPALTLKVWGWAPALTPEASWPPFPASSAPLRDHRPRNRCDPPPRRGAACCAHGGGAKGRGAIDPRRGAACCAHRGGAWGCRATTPAPLAAPNGVGIPQPDAIALLEKHRRYLTLRPLIEEGARLDTQIEAETMAADALKAQLRSVLRAAGVDSERLTDALAAFEDALPEARRPPGVRNRRRRSRTPSRPPPRRPHPRRTRRIAGRTRGAYGGYCPSPRAVRAPVLTRPPLPRATRPHRTIRAPAATPRRSRGHTARRGGEAHPRPLPPARRDRGRDRALGAPRSRGWRRPAPPCSWPEPRSKRR